MTMRLFIATFALVLASCASVPPAPKVAPWRMERLASAAVPAIYRTQWQKAENRDTCALIAPRSVGSVQNATPRAASFAGGWAVAYDTPELRSAFGVAGAGVKASDPSYSDWPYVQIWDDGSKVEYGPEGGTGPNQLAYLRIGGQDCLYNIWSRLGQGHLEHLIRELRFVE
jgi:hypothetical protein